MADTPHIYVALPVMGERDWLPATLDAIAGQRFRNFSVVICVNQPDSWWDDPEHAAICHDNQHLIDLLRSESRFPIDIMDRSSRGSGWQGKQAGVGWARKTVMDHCALKAEATDIILSLDADTLFAEAYFDSVARVLSNLPDAMALAVPYYHRVPADPRAARAILRYEIYMRYYLLNLRRIGSPYAFTALGSAMAVPVWAYRKVGGMTPRLSGEDFYFLQKLRKAGRLISWCGEKVHPAARFSSRVFFGTGPAMIRGANGDWDSYPVYPFGLFDEIAEGYGRFPELFHRFVDTPVTRFLREQAREEDPFALLRINFREPESFIRACHEKFDGLRILQYLKQNRLRFPQSDEQNLMEWLETFYSSDAGYRCFSPRDLGGIAVTMLPDPEHFSFTESSIETLDCLRNFLEREEEKYRRSSLLL
ncbi:MAG: hypothetical protein D4R67_08520 [Bacteroidetes bacterium]|nr:MAG: hypothetical protein D4R67_08520 [Bacteroidota bacterium]